MENRFLLSSWFLLFTVVSAITKKQRPGLEVIDRLVIQDEKTDHLVTNLSTAIIVEISRVGRCSVTLVTPLAGTGALGVAGHAAAAEFFGGRAILAKGYPAYPIQKAGPIL